MASLTAEINLLKEQASRGQDYRHKQADKALMYSDVWVLFFFAFFCFF